MTEGRGTQSQKGISASSAFVAPVVALRPNNALHSDAPRPAGSGFPRSLRSLGAGERER